MPWQPLLVTSLGLYFALLLTTIVAIVFIEDEFMAIVFSECVDGLLVGGWLVASGAYLAIRISWPRLYWLPASAGLAVLTFAVATLMVELMSAVFHIPKVTLAGEILGHGHGWFMVILLVCIQPAVVEELAFRGIVFNAMQRLLGDGGAILVSAALFMTIHLSVPSFPHLLLMGVVLANLRLHSGSLLPGMVLHFVHNLLCVVVEVWMGG